VHRPSGAQAFENPHAHLKGAYQQISSHFDMLYRKIDTWKAGGFVGDWNVDHADARNLLAQAKTGGDHPLVLSSASAVISTLAGRPRQDGGYKEA
jgi:hypothetical protein